MKMTQQEKELRTIAELMRQYNERWGYQHTSIFVIDECAHGVVYDDEADEDDDHLVLQFSEGV